MSETQALLSNIIEAIQDKKGKNITQVDLSEIEYATTQGFVICTGNTPIQVNAIADNVREAVAKKHRREALQLRRLHQFTMDRD